MAYIVINKEEKDADGMRQNMRRYMRGGYRQEGGAPVMRDDRERELEHHYKMGYKHGWEDHEDEMGEQYRRSRDSRGRFM